MAGPSCWVSSLLGAWLGKTNQPVGPAGPSVAAVRARDTAGYRRRVGGGSPRSGVPLPGELPRPWAMPGGGLTPVKPGGGSLNPWSGGDQGVPAKAGATLGVTATGRGQAPSPGEGQSPIPGLGHVRGPAPGRAPLGLVRGGGQGHPGGYCHEEGASPVQGLGLERAHSPRQSPPGGQKGTIQVDPEGHQGQTTTSPKGATLGVTATRRGQAPSKVWAMSMLTAPGRAPLGARWGPRGSPRTDQA